jgi:amino acid transporter
MNLINRFSNIITGKPLANEQAAGEKYNIPFGLAIMASDAISSVAYAAEEILTVLMVLGTLAYTMLGWIALAIIGLLIVVSVSYMQVIKAYPQGGGAYMVAKNNINTRAGLAAAAGLVISYILTVAVSASAGTDAIISAFQSVEHYKVLTVVCLITVLTILNLRGIGESSKIFAIPTYIFIFSMLTMIGIGIVEYMIDPSLITTSEIVSKGENVVNGISVMLILKAFSQGCSALTGVEAVSNSVPNFKEPCQRSANTVMILLSLTILLIFGGSAIMAGIVHAVPGTDMTVIAQIAIGVFGKSFMFYLIQISTAVILLMACNTAFTGFPMLMYVIAKDGYAPRQFTIRGKRLAFSIGIIVLSTIAVILSIVFKADVHNLLPLYSVGVFMSFTLAQGGMVLYWRKHREGNWKLRATINGFGALMTLLTTAIIAYEKFLEGAWIVVILLPLLVMIMEAIHKHYNKVAEKLKASADDLALANIGKKYKHIIILPMASLNKASLGALEYAKSISDTVIALNVSHDKEQIEKLEQKFKDLQYDVHLESIYSPFRQTVTPLIENIRIIANSTSEDEKVTVLLPEFVTQKWWGNLLHNHTGLFIREKLLQDEQTEVVVSTYPYYLNENE